MAKLEDVIRQAIAASGQTRYRIAKETGISQTHLSRLMRGTRGLSASTVERLAAYLGLEIIVQPAKTKEQTGSRTKRGNRKDSNDGKHW